MVRRLGFLLVIVVAASGCALTGLGGDPDAPADGDDGAPVAPAAPAADGTLTIGDGGDGPALVISDALGVPGEPIRVQGSLFIDEGGGMLLCEAVAESFPPQCGGTRLRVVGLDPDDVEGLQSADAVRWADTVELSGTVD
jgi:hypothetical protein